MFGLFKKDEANSFTAAAKSLQLTEYRNETFEYVLNMLLTGKIGART